MPKKLFLWQNYDEGHYLPKPSPEWIDAYEAGIWTEFMEQERPIIHQEEVEFSNRGLEIKNYRKMQELSPGDRLLEKWKS